MTLYNPSGKETTFEKVINPITDYVSDSPANAVKFGLSFMTGALVFGFLTAAINADQEPAKVSLASSSEVSQDASSVKFSPR